MSILIKGMEMPTEDEEIMIRIDSSGTVMTEYALPISGTKAAPVPEPHGRLIDADALRRTMYHEAFETDSPMQKWNSGCWIRYKMFENMEENAPTIIPAEEGET